MPFWSSIFRSAHRAGTGGGLARPGGAASTAVLPTGDEWLMRAEEEPRDPLARQRAGDELARRGDHAGAIRSWLTAADLYMSQGFAVRALAVLVCVLRVDPDNDEVRDRIANIAR